jgi:hypothetical protein
MEAVSIPLAAPTAGASVAVATSVASPLIYSGTLTALAGIACIGNVLMNEDSSGTRPPNLSPPGAKRRGALRQVKRDEGIPVSSQPDSQLPNLDKRGVPQPGRVYKFTSKDVNNNPIPGSEKYIRDDSKGHYFGSGDPQNRGSHFNGPKKGSHYDY